ncbi:MAG: biotin--[acetyl-CoA-carboxylase] ligase [Elusimicrobia bacterium]|nr:biotin--[acetyl-CoA-carboxylase] ligase [Elusimicrobiota bacterium]
MKIFDKKIIRFAKINSTQDYAKKIADKSPSGTIVVAERQTNGRGQFERDWSSSKGGLYFSIILKPRISPDKIPELTLKMAAAIIDALKIEKPKIFIKLPNDIMVSPKSEVRSPKKIAGILTESSITGNKIDWVVVGVGVNINNKIPKELKKIAVSLKEITKKNWNVKKIFKEIIKKFVSTNRIDFSGKF